MFLFLSLFSCVNKVLILHFYYFSLSKWELSSFWKLFKSSKSINLTDFNSFQKVCNFCKIV
jgi:hypothetical protein